MEWSFKFGYVRDSDVDFGIFWFVEGKIVVDLNGKCWCERVGFCGWYLVWFDDGVVWLMCFL